MSERPQASEPPVRTFRAPNMLAALEAVQRELGSEALVLSARRVSPGFPRSLWQGGVEVMAMAPARETAVPSPVPRAVARPAGITGAKVGRVAQSNGASRPGSGALAEVCRRLEGQGVDSAWVRRAAERCRRSLPAVHLDDAQRVRSHLAAQLLAALRARPAVTLEETPLLCLAGPRGGGKTTTLAKVAAHLRRGGAESVLWVCADTFRVGALAQAQVFAESLDLALRPVYTPEELAAVVEQAPQGARLLVDLPGFNPRDETEVALVGEFLDLLSEKSLYLVLPASAKTESLLEAMTALKPFAPRGVVVTRLAETATFGNLFDALRCSGLPLLYVAFGPRVLEGIRPAEPRDLVQALLEGRWKP